MKIKFLLFLNIFLTLGWSQKISFLIVERPEALKLLNNYRQEMDEMEKRNLGRFVPFQLNKVTTLSDNVTKAYQVKVLNNNYFLLLDSQGEPLNLTEAGFSKYESRVTLLMDTVQIRPGFRVTLLHPASKRKIKELNAGQRLIRIFRKFNTYYVALPSAPPLFGLVKITSQRIWEKVNKERFGQVQKVENFLESLQFFVQNKNRIYRKLFEYFKGSVTTAEVPQWKILRSGPNIMLVFSQPDLLKKWPQSTKQFIKEAAELARKNGFQLSVQNEFTLKISRRGKQ